MPLPTLRHLLFPSAVAVLLAGCATPGAQQPGMTAASLPADSSYACHYPAVPGQPTEGDGSYGCYFELHDTTSRQKLANTPYELVVFKSERDRTVLVSVDGVTDDQGRSAFVRTAEPVVIGQVRFVQTIGTGKASRAAQMVRPTDGGFVPFNPYRIAGCGLTHEGVSDERGYTVSLHCETQSNVKVEFYRKR